MIRPATHADTAALVRIWHDSWHDAHDGHVPPGLVRAVCDRRTGIEMLARSVGAFPLSAGSDDAVLNIRLTPGSYTVTLSTGDGQPGAGLLEVYASSTYSLPAP